MDPLSVRAGADVVTPDVGGIPFFYWYQMLWIVLGVAVMLPIYFSEERGKDG